MARLFGTDGIRGVANVDLKPTIAYDLGRATARRLAGPGGAIVVGQDTRRSGDMFVAAIVSGATSLGVDVHRVGVVPTPGPRLPRRVGRVRGRDHGLGVAQPGRGQRAQGPRLGRAQARRRRRGRARAADLALGRAGRPSATPSSVASIDAAGLLDRYRDHRVRLARTVPTDLRIVARLRQRLGLRGRRRRSSRRPAPRSRSSTPSRTGSNINLGLRGHRAGVAGGGGRRARRRPRVRPRRRRRPLRRRRRDAGGSSTATSSSGSSPSTGSPAARSTAAASSCRSSRTAASRASSRRPAGSSSGRPSATSTSSRGCRSSGAGPRRREERPRDRPRAQHIGRRHRDRPRGAPGDRPARSDRSPSWPPRSRSCPSSSAPSRLVTRTSGRATRSSSGRSPRRPPGSAPAAGSSSGRRAPSRPCGSWSRDRTPSWSAELADEIATLAGERLN